MDAKRFSDVLSQFRAIFHPSPTGAVEELRKLLPGLLDLKEAMLAPPVIEDSINVLAGNMQLVQKELDKMWRCWVLKNLVVLASEGKDFRTSLLQCRGKLDFMFFAKDPKILAANTAAYLEMGRSISNLVQNSKMSDSSFEKADQRFMSVVLRTRLFDWIERFIKEDLYRRAFDRNTASSELQLSKRARDLLDGMRDDRILNAIRDEILECVYYSVDQRNLWAELERQSFSDREIQSAVYRVAGNLQEILDCENDPNFKQYGWMRAGAFRSGRDHEPYVLPEFRNIPQELQSHAQGMYDMGHTVDEAISIVKLELQHNTRSELKALDEGANLHDLIDQLNETEHVDNIKSTSDESEQDELSSETDSLIEHTNEYPHRTRMVEELIKSFPKMKFEEFANINLGLTPVMAANYDSIKASLTTAFNWELPESGPVLGDWWRRRKNRNIWMVALSYKHKSREVRLTENTIDKVARVLSEIAISEGFKHIVVWLDTICSQNKRILGKDSRVSWAVSGLYPYLTNNVVRLVGKDEDYDDRDGSSMWMKVEQMCADSRSCITVTIDKSCRGYSWVLGCPLEPYKPAESRMMDLARYIARGDLVDKVVSWVEDKQQLVLWAEASMLAKFPLLMSEEDLKDLSTLRIDNILDEDISEYMTIAQKERFIHFEKKPRRGLMSSWLGLFEFFPGFAEVSKRNFRPLFPCVDPSSIRVVLEDASQHVHIFGKLGTAFFELELSSDLSKVLEFNALDYDELPDFESIMDFDLNSLDESKWR